MCLWRIRRKYSVNRSSSRKTGNREIYMPLLRARYDIVISWCNTIFGALANENPALVSARVHGDSAVFLLSCSSHSWISLPCIFFALASRNCRLSPVLAPGIETGVISVNLDATRAAEVISMFISRCGRAWSDFSVLPYGDLTRWRYTGLDTCA